MNDNQITMDPSQNGLGGNAYCY